jgi:hypothetical protein
MLYQDKSGNPVLDYHESLPNTYIPGVGHSSQMEAIEMIRFFYLSES